MKIFLTVLLFIPSLSWGNVDKYYCKKTDHYDQDANKIELNEKTDLLEDPYGFDFELDHTNKTFKKGSFSGPYTKNGNIYIVESDVTTYEFNTENNVWVLFHDIIGIIWFECLTEPEYQIFLKQKEPSYKIDQCLDLGFKKGTEGLKNCVLELS